MTIRIAFIGGYRSKKTGFGRSRIILTYRQPSEAPSSDVSASACAMPLGSQLDRMVATCSAKPGAAEDYPFGDEVAVYKVAGRMFALVPLGGVPGSVSLKCDPGLTVGLRGRYAGVTPGYHLNKRHWNTVTLDGSVPEEEVLELLGSDVIIIATMDRCLV